MITKKDLNRAWEMKQEFEMLYGRGIISIENSGGIHLTNEAFLKVINHKPVEVIDRNCEEYPYELICEIDDEITVFMLVDGGEQTEIFEQFGVEGLKQYYYRGDE